MVNIVAARRTWQDMTMLYIAFSDAAQRGCACEHIAEYWRQRAIAAHKRQRGN